MARFSTCRQADTDELARTLGEVFARRDPPAVAVGLTPGEFKTFVRLLCPSAAEQGLTIIARSEEKGEMIGALLTEDLASPLPDGLGQLSPKFNPIFDILGQLDEEFRGAREIHPGEALHLFLLGVSESAAGQGLAQQLVAECLAHGALKGYRRAVTEATNKTSQHIFRKHGFEERVRRSYEDHRFEGRAWFASIVEHGGPMLMEKALGA